MIIARVTKTGCEITWTGGGCAEGNLVYAVNLHPPVRTTGFQMSLARMGGGRVEMTCETGYSFYSTKSH